MLDRWKSKLAALPSSAEGLNIVIAGDSSFSGMWASSWEKSSAGLLYKHFKNKYGATSYTQGAYQPMSQPFPAISELNYTRYYGTWIEWNGVGVARGPLSLGDDTGGVSRVFTGVGFRLYMAGWPYCSQMELAIDGGAPILVMGGDTAGKDFVIYESPRLAYGAHSFDLKINGTSSSGACIYAVEIIEDAENTGVRLHNISVPGLKTGDLFVTNEFQDNQNTNLPCALKAFRPDLTVICLGINDMMEGVSKAQFASNYRNILLYIQENIPGCDILLVSHGLIGEAENKSGVPQSEYMAAVSDIAGESGAAHLDLCDLWSGGYSLTPAQMNEVYGYYPDNDLLHPNDKGHQAMAESVAGLIEPPPTPPEEHSFCVRLYGDTPLPAAGDEAVLYLKYKGGDKGVYVSVPGSGMTKL